MRPRRAGLISIVLPATDQPGNPAALGAFPINCCYQLRLDAWERTIVNCSDVFQNTSKTSFRSFREVVGLKSLPRLGEARRNGARGRGS